MLRKATADAMIAGCRAGIPPGLVARGRRLRRRDPGRPDHRHRPAHYPARRLARTTIGPKEPAAGSLGPHVSERNARRRDRRWCSHCSERREALPLAPAGDVDGLLDSKHFECRVPGRDGANLVIAGVRPGAFEEDPDLRLPPLEVGAQHRHFLIVSELPAAKVLSMLAQAQLPRADGPQVAHPLSLAAGRDEVPAAIVGEQVHRGGTPLSTRPALHRKDSRPENADALPGQERDGLVEDIASEPAGGAVVIGHASQPSCRLRNELTGPLPAGPVRIPRGLRRETAILAPWLPTLRPPLARSARSSPDGCRTVSCTPTTWSWRSWTSGP